MDGEDMFEPLSDVIPENALVHGDGDLAELAEGTVTDVVAQHMEISQPLASLKTMLEGRLGVNLKDYSFYLQDVQELDEDRNLVDQCVQGEGIVQVNVELANRQGRKKINIVDVLKPADETLAELEAEQAALEEAVKQDKQPQEQVTKWVVSPEFKFFQEKEGIPINPTLWTPAHTLRWFKWAAKHFKLPAISINPDLWKITGKDLNNMSHEEFLERVPYDPSDVMWTHLELLRKCKIVAIVQNSEVGGDETAGGKGKKTGTFKRPAGMSGRKAAPIGPPAGSRHALEVMPGNKSGNNGQVQLWQFLLELLTDKDAREYIMWIGDDGEFKLVNPEMVAQMWGLRKNKPTMNYEKLSRALRYYYDGDMISKVQGKRFVYKFVVDLKQLIGYDASELNRLVMEAEQRKISQNLQGYQCPPTPATPMIM